uniref:Uncharacterized protein n=1 Tax=viral metagenome TaxID=1070528 RepID=A0A6C0DHX0_9ZZZZ
MYKALKSAQNDIHEALLKFADEANSLSAKGDSGCQCKVAAPVAAPVSGSTNLDDTRLQDIESSIQYLNQKLNAQFSTLITSVENLNGSLANVVKLLLKQNNNTVETSTIIPNLAPQAQGYDLKNVQIETDNSHVGETQQIEQSLDTPMGIDSADDASEIMDDIEDEEVPDVVEDEEVPDVVEEEEGIEVEDWVYKGRNFFKDSENTVYANNNGELGDPIGLYDPVKNIVKKLATSS